MYVYIAPQGGREEGDSDARTHMRINEGGTALIKRDEKSEAPVHSEKDNSAGTTNSGGKR